MLHSMDFNGNKVRVGDDVLVPKPAPTDIHKKEFVGRITEFRNNGSAVVMNEEGETFDLAPNRLESVSYF